MSARDVIAKAIRETSHVSLSLSLSDAILSALDAAGYVQPVHTGAIHRALQDAFQAGAKSALREDGPSITADKHTYCDAALSALQAKETP